MNLEQQLLTTFGPLLTLEQLAQLLHRSPKGLRGALSLNSEFSRQINATKIRFGRRVYFRAGEVAVLLAGSTTDIQH